MSGSSELPPLPRIDGEAILGVFTHTSIRPAGPETVGPDSFGGNHRLNELGTKVLEMAFTAALFAKRPMLTAEGLARERNEFLSDHRIDDYVRHYQLRDKLIYALTAEEEVRSSKESRFLFASYMGAVYAQSGLAPVESWVNSVVYADCTPPPTPPPYAASRSPASPDKYLFRSDPVPPQPLGAPPPPPPPGLGFQPSLALVNQTATQKGYTPIYTAESSGPAHTPLWVVHCLINGVEKGRGSGKSQKIAKEEAARSAFYNMGWGSGV